MECHSGQNTWSSLIQLNFDYVLLFSLSFVCNPCRVDGSHIAAQNRTASVLSTSACHRIASWWCYVVVSPYRFTACSSCQHQTTSQQLIRFFHRFVFSHQVQTQLLLYFGTFDVERFRSGAYVNLNRMHMQRWITFIKHFMFLHVSLFLWREFIARYS